MHGPCFKGAIHAENHPCIFFLLWSVVLGDMFGDICHEYNEMEIAYLSKHCFEQCLIETIFFLLTTSTWQKLS